MTTMRLRHLADVNPATKAFDELKDEEKLTFLPMEAVWPGERLDLSRRRAKATVATGYTRFQDGDVLVPKITPTFEAGRAVLVSGLLGGVGAGTTELHVLRPGPRIEPRFLFYVVNTHSFLKLGEAEMYGVAGQQRVPDTFLRDFAIKLPVLEEQRRIADFLDAEIARIDRLTTLQIMVLEKLDERETAMLDLAIDELIGRAGTRPLRRHIWSVDQGTSPQCDAIPAEEDEWGVLKVSCLRPGEFFAQENKRLPDETAPDVSSEVCEGDLLITRANTPQLVGSTAVVGQVRSKLLLSDKIFRVRLEKTMLPDFVATVARGSRIRAMCSASSNGASQSMANIRFEEVKAWPMPAVALSEQVKFVNRIRESRASVERLRPLVKQQLKLLAERRQALITATVTGQFDVSSASGRGVEA
ncbi:hypothetical protein GCM10017673_28830 [Streptosporangium violaceochromogenes]|nr:hypothetical protein GCM10017673_28830 [Streptosporangium violaceochromogenes]